MGAGGDGLPAGRMMPAETDRRLRSVALNYRRLVRELPEPLKAQARSLTGALAPGSKDLVEYYGAKEAYPLLWLPLWLEDKYVREGRISGRKGYGVKTATAALFGYLYIRIQDNVLDEPDQFDAAYLLLCNEFVREFFERYNALFPSGSPFWGYLRNFWRGTTNNTLWERNLCAGTPGRFAKEDLARIGGKLDGVKVSVAAFCLLADAEDDTARLCGAMDRLNIASQLHNDVVSFVKDLRHSYFTTVIANTIGEGEHGVDTEELFRKASIKALTGRHLEDWLERATKYNEGALEFVETGELPGLEEYIRLKNAHLDRLGKELAEIKKDLLFL